MIYLSVNHSLRPLLCTVHYLYSLLNLSFLYLIS